MSRTYFTLIAILFSVNVFGQTNYNLPISFEIDQTTINRFVKIKYDDPTFIKQTSGTFNNQPYQVTLIKRPISLIGSGSINVMFNLVVIYNGSTDSLTLKTPFYIGNVTVDSNKVYIKLDSVQLRIAIDNLTVDANRKNILKTFTKNNWHNEKINLYKGRLFNEIPALNDSLFSLTNTGFNNAQISVVSNSLLVTLTPVANAKKLFVQLTGKFTTGNHFRYYVDSNFPIKVKKIYLKYKGPEDNSPSGEYTVDIPTDKQQTVYWSGDKIYGTDVLEFTINLNSFIYANVIIYIEGEYNGVEFIRGYEYSTVNQEINIKTDNSHMINGSSFSSY